MHSADS